MQEIETGGSEVEASLDNIVRLSQKKMWALVRHQWLIPIILATQEAEIRRIMVRS
jgi:hypothetical protein